MSTPLASASTLGNPAALAKVNQLKAQPRKQGEAAFFFYDAHFKNAAALAVMRSIKATLDPLNILNPGKVL